MLDFFFILDHKICLMFSIFNNNRVDTFDQIVFILAIVIMKPI